MSPTGPDAAKYENSDETGASSTRTDSAVAAPLVDRFGRVHSSLRMSVTDRCNLRCFYCMPEVGAQFAPREQLLTFEEIERLVEVLVGQCGIRDVRVTGGEPLVRRGLSGLIERLAAIDGLEDLSLTTNGILLVDQAEGLRAAGLKRINISLDTVDEEVFQKITRRKGVDQVIAGIDEAIRVGFDSIKLNTTAVKGIVEKDVVALVEFAMDRDIELRFIEFMPLDTDRAWKSEDVLSGDEIQTAIESRFGKMTQRHRPNESQPAEDFEIAGGARVGLIRSITAPFCSTCNRLRVTADGSIRNCLFAQSETPLRDHLRGGASADEIIALFQQSVAEKAAGHGIDQNGFSPPDRPMYAIGG